MSKRREDQARERALIQLREILEAMKNLALIEIGKLGKTHTPRRHLLDELTAIAAATRVDSSTFTFPTRGPEESLRVLIGSERGLCSDFNDRIAQRCLAAPENVLHTVNALVVGEALAEKLSSTPLPIRAVVAGPTALEEVDTVLAELLTRIADEQARSSHLRRFSAVAMREHGVEEIAVLPFAAPPQQRQPPRRAPEFNLPLKRFARELIDAYMDALLHDLLVSSLLAENRARLTHMTAAINRIDDETVTLRQRQRRVRQEEITMEIEGIVLSTLQKP